MEKLLSGFNLLRCATSLSDVQDVLAKTGIPERFHMKASKYPELTLKFTKIEIEELINRDAISEQYEINPPEESDALSKLLYATLWKNGDLPKIKHILKGVLNGSEVPDKGIVFHQFGKHLLKNSHEPIIDQHVIRAFGVYQSQDDEREIDRLIKMSSVSVLDKKYIPEYRSWLKTKLRSALREEQNYIFHVDKVLFAIGKYIKNAGYQSNSI